MLRCWGLLFGLLVAGCSRTSQAPTASSESSSVKPTSNSASNAAPRSVSTLPPDDLGRAVSFSAPPRRIVALAPGVTETIFALGEGGRLVGRDQMSDFPAQAQKAAIVGDFNGPFFEKVVAARPDLIIQQGETWGRDRIELWQRKCGAPVVLLNPASVQDVARGIEKIAAWLGVPDRAKPLTRDLLEAGPKTEKGQSFVLWPAFVEIGRSPLWSAGSDTLIGDVLRRAGLKNAAQIRGYKAYSLESLAKANPDFYVVTENKPDVARTLRDLRANATLRHLKCIRRGRVIVAPADWVLRPGPRLGKGIREIERQKDELATRDSNAPGELKN